MNMNIKWRLTLLTTIVLSALAFAPSPMQAQSRSSEIRRVRDAIPNQYIVVLKDDTPASAVTTIAADLAHAHGGRTKHVTPNRRSGF